MLAIPRLGIIRLIASITTATTSRETAGGQPVMSKRIIRASSMKSSALIQVKSLTPPDSFIAHPVAKSRYRYSLDNCRNSPCFAVTILAASCAPHIGSASIPTFPAKLPDFTRATSHPGKLDHSPNISRPSRSCVSFPVIASPPNILQRARHMFTLWRKVLCRGNHFVLESWGIRAKSPPRCNPTCPTCSGRVSETCPRIAKPAGR